MQAIYLRTVFLLPIITAVGACVAWSQDFPAFTVCQVPELAAELKGRQVSIRGQAVTSDHDLLLVSENCPDIKLDLEFPDKVALRPPAAFTLLEDGNFKKFRRFLFAKNKNGSYRYKVLATFHGRLDVSDTAGFIRDKDGKITGVAGYGSPFPYTRFRLVIRLVSDVTATPYPQVTRNRPEVLFAVAPVFPDITAPLPEDKDMQAEIEVTVDNHGMVVAAKPVWGDPALYEPSLKAAKRWAFDTSPEKERKVKLSFTYRVLSDELPPDQLTPVFLPPFHVEVRRKAGSVTCGQQGAALDAKNGSSPSQIPLAAGKKPKQ